MWQEHAKNFDMIDHELVDDDDISDAGDVSKVLTLLVLLMF